MAAGQAGYSSVPQSERSQDLRINKTPGGFGVRHAQAFILFISLSVGYSMRAHLSVTMVAMTGAPTDVICRYSAPDLTTSKDVSTDSNSVTSLLAAHATESNITGRHTAANLTTPDDNTIDSNSVTTLFEANDTELNETGHLCKDGDRQIKKLGVNRTYKWHKSTQEMILFSFFVGYTSMMLPMGLLAQRVGGKIPIMVALGVNGILSILTPWLPIFGDWLAVCACRLLQGMTQAAFYPSIHTMLGKWAPLSERGRLSTYIYTGSQFGTVLIFQLSGLLAGSPSFGWPSTFWLCGVASLACFGLVAWLGAATPQEHPTISSEELAYITGDGSVDTIPKKRKTPWKHMLSSSAVWALVASHAGSAVGYLFILTQIPLYMNTILGIDIKRNGVYSSLPYISMYIMALLFGSLSDFCVNRKIMSIANIRRVANSIGMVVASGFLIAFSYVSNTAMGIALLVACLGAHSGVHVGFHINQIDLAPNFAGPIMAFGNMVANLASLALPVLVSNIVGDDVGNQHKWQIMFLIVAALQVVTNIIFVVFVKGTVQPWNYYGEDENGSETEVVCTVKAKISTTIQEPAKK